MQALKSVSSESSAHIAVPPKALMRKTRAPSRKSTAQDQMPHKAALPETSSLSAVDGHSLAAAQSPCAEDSAYHDSQTAKELSPPIDTVPDESPLIQESVEGPCDNGTHPALADCGFLIPAIREVHRRRCDLIAAEGNLMRQIKAIERRMHGAWLRAQGKSDDDALAELKSDAELPEEIKHAVAVSTAPLQMALDALHPHKLQTEKELKKMALQLPAYAFVESVHGFGAVGFAQIVGEAGDLANYANPAKLWKRFGLGLVGQERQHKTTDAALAIEMGYSPKRRSIMFVIGDSLLKKQNPYKELYNERKAFEVSKAEAAGKQVLPATKITKKNAANCMSQGHVHLRAKRYVEKRLLRDLWRFWNNTQEQA